MRPKFDLFEIVMIAIMLACVSSATLYLREAWTPQHDFASLAMFVLLSTILGLLADLVIMVALLLVLASVALVLKGTQGIMGVGRGFGNRLAGVFGKLGGR